MMSIRQNIGLTGNQLKLIALVAMTADHVGLVILPQYTFLRAIGRLAFPIFAFMIAEGCRYTRSMPRYLGLMAGLGAICQIVYFVAMGSLFQSILVTFTMSIALIWLFDIAVRKKQAGAWLAAGLGVALAFFLTAVLPAMLTGTDYAVDHGFWGVMLPVGVYFAKGRQRQLGITAAILICISTKHAAIQYFSLLALPLLALYNGQRGKHNRKYLFYVYYPLHLVVINAIGELL